MDRRSFLRSAGAGALMCGAVETRAAQENMPLSSASPPRRPSILFVLLDDLGWGDLGCYGHPVLRTPNLDRLADQGCRFTDFYAAAPLCSPTRAACLTGRDPNRYGFKHVVNTGMVNPNVTVPEVHHLPVDEPTLPRQLRGAGYRTGTVGKWHLSLTGIASEPKPDAYGFDHYFICNGSGSLYHGPGKWSRNGLDVDIAQNQWYPDLYIDEAIAFLDSCGDKPFCLNLWPFSPHVREEAAERYRAMYTGHTEAEKTYYGCITQMDEQLGRLFDHLERTGRAADTIVVVTSDNGPEPALNLANHPEARRGSTGGLRGSKHVLYEGGIRVPGIVRWPGLSRPRSVSAEPVSVLDLMPTLCAAAGVEMPTGWTYDGADFRPALLGNAVTRHHPLYWQCEYAMNTFVGPQYHSQPLALRQGPWKLMCDLEFSNARLHNLEWDRNEQYPVEQEHSETAESMLKSLKAIHADVNGPYQQEAKYLNPEILAAKSRKP